MSDEPLSDVPVEKKKPSGDISGGPESNPMAKLKAKKEAADKKAK